MKNHIDDGASGSNTGGPGKEGLYARANPMSPTHHIMASNITTGPPNIMPNVQSVLHLPQPNQTQTYLSQPPQPGTHHSPVREASASGITPVQYQFNSLPVQAKSNPVHQHQTQAHSQPMHIRHKIHPSNSANASVLQSSVAQAQNFQRLKVEDALSYLDQVKYKFGNQPQVYNDFLDIMKEFKSQSIDTPGVIQRVSNLFKGHPELIVGFNTFLPPGYKIEVQSNEQGYAFQVSVSMPSPTSSTPSLLQTSHHQVSASQTETITFLPGGVKHTTMNSHVPRGDGVSPPQQSSSLHYQPLPPPLPPPTVPAPLPNTNNVRAAVSLSPAPNQLPLVQPTHSNSSNNNLESNHPTPQNQPVEFNHAINYVNKIKNRFQGQPDKYKRFLEILHTYQKEQRNIKEGTSGPVKHLTEAEVYSQVSKLFEHQEDLLAEFGQFLPDATSHLNTKNLGVVDHLPTSKKNCSSMKCNYGASTSRDSSVNERETGQSSSGSRSLMTCAPSTSKQSQSQLKRSSSFSSSGVHKKQKMASLKDVSLFDAAKYCNLGDFAFFDKVRNSLKNTEVYENFLRCLFLYNQELVSKADLVQMVTPFLSRQPELLNHFKEMVSFSETTNNQASGSAEFVDIAPSNMRQGELAVDVDYTTCKRLGASYCALPKAYLQVKCSGRTALCKQVLNDTWVSFPSWSEDSTFVTSRKTQYEEYIYRCEDERFELDVVISNNFEVIQILESVHKRIQRMTTDEANRFRLDEKLGGTCPTAPLLAIRRLYADHTPQIMDALQKSPVAALPVVLKRLKKKDEEWREVQKGFNKIWREQNEKYYLKSLDHQGINFKQIDLKVLRSKSLFNEIETILDERHESNEDTGPHLTFPYIDKSILDDACNLLIHHVKRLSGIHKEDKHKMKVILRQFVPDLFHHTRQELSDDEKEDEKEEDFVIQDPTPEEILNNEKLLAKFEVRKDQDYKFQNMGSYLPDESYTLFMGNNNWYLFLRLHQILCERLSKMHQRACILAVEDSKEKESRPSEPISEALRLKKKLEVNVEDFYPTFLDMVKNVLDGNMDNSSYEDSLREMFTIHAYIAFTMDKVVSYAVRQLQHIVCDDISQDCIKMFKQEQKRGGAGGLCATAHQRLNAEILYQKKFEQALSDENCFKIYIFKCDCKITFELLDNDAEEAEPEVTPDKEEPIPEHIPENEQPDIWSNYVEHKFAQRKKTNETPCLTIHDLPRPEKPVVLPRNIRSWRRANGGMHTSSDSDDEHDDGEKDEMLGDDEMNKDDTTSGECHLDLSSCKVLFVINKENFIYKKNCFARAKQTHPTLSKAKNIKFRKWSDAWVDKNVTVENVRNCHEWLMGRGEDVIPNKTIIVNNNDIKKPPYKFYNKYLVKRVD